MEDIENLGTAIINFIIELRKIKMKFNLKLSIYITTDLHQEK